MNLILFTNVLEEYEYKDEKNSIMKTFENTKKNEETSFGWKDPTLDDILNHIIASGPQRQHQWCLFSLPGSKSV